MTRAQAFGVVSMALGFSGTVLALDEACQRIVEADAAKVKAPSWHQRVVDSGPEGMTLEFIKSADKLFARQGGTWRAMPPGMLKTLGQVGHGGFKLSQCRKVGDDVISGMPSAIYAYTVNAGGHVAAGNKVWIGRDGLPYRMEGDNVKTTIQYVGVVVPKVSR